MLYGKPLFYDSRDGMSVYEASVCFILDNQVIPHK